jgi:hypothetical protein
MAMQAQIKQVGASVTTALFRRTAQGWVFRASTLLGLGPQPHFLLDDVQKERVELACGAVSLANFVALVLPIAWLVSYSFLPLHTRSNFDNHLLIAMALCLLVTVAHHVARFFALRPILRNLPRSAERITLRERLEPLVARLSYTSLVLMLLFTVATMSLFAVLDVLTSRVNLMTLVVFVVMACVAVLYGALIWIKRGITARP